MLKTSSKPIDFYIAGSYHLSIILYGIIPYIMKSRNSQYGAERVRTCARTSQNRSRLNSSTTGAARRAMLMPRDNHPYKSDPYTQHSRKVAPKLVTYRSPRLVSVRNYLDGTQLLYCNFAVQRWKRGRMWCWVPALEARRRFAFGKTAGHGRAGSKTAARGPRPTPHSAAFPAKGGPICPRWNGPHRNRARSRHRSQMPVLEREDA